MSSKFGVGWGGGESLTLVFGFDECNRTEKICVTLQLVPVTEYIIPLAVASVQSTLSNVRSSQKSSSIPYMSVCAIYSSVSPQNKNNLNLKDLVQVSAGQSMHFSKHKNQIFSRRICRCKKNFLSQIMSSIKFSFGKKFFFGSDDSVLKFCKKLISFFFTEHGSWKPSFWGKNENYTFFAQMTLESCIKMRFLP